MGRAYLSFVAHEQAFCFQNQCFPTDSARSKKMGERAFVGLVRIMINRHLQGISWGCFKMWVGQYSTSILNRYTNALTRWPSCGLDAIRAGPPTLSGTRMKVQRSHLDSIDFRPFPQPSCSGSWVVGCTVASMYFR